MDELVLQNQRIGTMNNYEKDTRSGSTAIVFFTAISSVTAIATALLPFALHA
jgi:hypothetical protein